MTNNKVVLVTRPDDDSTLNFLYHWTEDIITFAEKRGFTLLDLSGAKSNKKYLESYISKNNPGLILFNGHGTKDSILGYDEETIVKLHINDNVLINRIVYARSCESGKELGREGKAKAFIGYEWNFIFYYNQNNVSHPKKDKLAKRFLEPSNLVSTTLLKHKTVNEADTRSKKLMLKYYFEMMSSNGTYEEQKVASFLWSNIAGQRLYGNPEAHI
jgi:hypothetical protein